ncbi:MAG TPA: GTP-binding protein, partial [Myxococcales bacterium]
MAPPGSSALRLEEETRELVRVVAMGSVDDGKSTLLGRLLYETGALYDDQLAAVKRASRLGGEIDFSLFTDGLRAEREQGITIDVAYRYFSTPRRKFILGDTPGHAQYTRNMATGASTADVGIVLIDARLGVLPQSRRHLAIAALLGIPRLAVCINKLDLVGFDRGVYERISAEVRAFAARLGFADLRLFPVSARDGDNVAERSARTPWHKDGTLLDFLETVPVAREAASGRLRFPVQAVIRADPDYRGYAGRIASGTVRVGDEVVVLPSGARTRVQSIDTFEGQLLVASAPLSITLRLADAVDASRGDLIAPAGAAPVPRTELEANAVWLSERPLDPGRAYLLKHTTRLVPARVEAVRWRLDPETLEEQPAVRLELNELGRIAVRCMRPVATDAYADNRATGAFILIDALTNDTVAAGTVVESASSEGALEEPGDAQPVSAEERRARLGHRAAIVLAGDERAAAVLERSLFDRGCAVTVVRSAEAALACAAAGLVVI